MLVICIHIKFTASVPRCHMLLREMLHPEDMLEKHTLWSQILTELKSDQLEAQSKSCRWSGVDKQSTTANKEGSSKG